MKKPEVVYGGQAVIEGVMMRGPDSWAVAVRRPDQSIVVKKEPLKGISSSRIWRRPFIRGVMVLYEALVIGIQALTYSAEQAVGGEEEHPVGRWEIAATLILGLGLGIVLFVVIPTGLAHLVRNEVPSSLGQNIVEGVVRLAVFLLYILLVGMIPDIRRVFAYHGAEHRVVNACEAEAELTPDGVRRFSVLHPRCGTAFLLMVMVLSIFVFSLLGKQVLWWRIVSRILLLPLIAAISYEMTRFGASNMHNPFIRALITPGLWLQRMTTREPDDLQAAVALAALEAVLVKEGEHNVREAG
ncbi:MAG: DUF1385 domain-containing protein [Bacillota bacterium]